MTCRIALLKKTKRDFQIKIKVKYSKTIFILPVTVAVLNCAYFLVCTTATQFSLVKEYKKGIQMRFVCIVYLCVLINNLCYLLFVFLSFA